MQDREMFNHNQGRPLDKHPGTIPLWSWVEGLNAGQGDVQPQTGHTTGQTPRYYPTLIMGVRTKCRTGRNFRKNAKCEFLFY